MSFDSIHFFYFALIFYFILFLLKSRNLKLWFLLIMSYYFYGSWNWRFLIILFFSSYLDYSIGLLIERKRKLAKIFLSISIFINIGLLLVFKILLHNSSIFNGMHFNLKSILSIGIPIGISFYTFQTLSYTIDIFRKKISAEKSYLIYFTYVSFFPQLVAGPIERANDLIPQLKRKLTLSLTSYREPIWLIVYGLFQKTVVSDNLKLIIKNIFDENNFKSFYYYWIGGIIAVAMIYTDFSGYSKMARGLAKLMGVNLTKNFGLPLFASSPREFWANWHITLTSWIRDYIYHPLVSLDQRRGLYLKQSFIAFIVIGLWHLLNYCGFVFGLVNWIIYAGSLYLSKTNLRFHLFIKVILLNLINGFAAISLVVINRDQLNYILFRSSLLDFHDYSEAFSFFLLGFIFYLPVLIAELIMLKNNRDEFALCKKKNIFTFSIGVCIFFILTTATTEENLFVYFRF